MTAWLRGSGRIAPGSTKQTSGAPKFVKRKLTKLELVDNLKRSYIVITALGRQRESDMQTRHLNELLSRLDRLFDIGVAEIRMNELLAWYNQDRTTVGIWRDIL